MTKAKPVIFWFRNDLRLADNPALAAACDTRQPVIPVFIHDDSNAGIWKNGGATNWWLHQSLDHLAAAIDSAGLHPLVFCKGDAKIEIAKLVKETGADHVFWNRCYEPWAIARDKKIKEDLKNSGVDAQSFSAFLLFEPWEILNKTGNPYKVFTPYSKACLEHGGIRPPVSGKLKSDGKKIISGLPLEKLGLMPKIKWYTGMADAWTPGEAGAKKRLKKFIAGGLEEYKEKRDFPAVDGGSKLSPHLHFGEISPHTIWHDVSKAIAEAGHNNAFANHGQGYLRQLLWREFSWHLLYHFPTFPEKAWNPRFADFKWNSDNKLLNRWKKGKTGYPIIDAGMRELWQTGWMHNRVRMLVGSFLVKNLLLDWRDGEDWFWDTLVDADLGNNAQGWQWIAGCGADAAPYFRIFNPILQSRKFDEAGEYIRRYVPELAKLPDEYIHAPWEAPPMELHRTGITLGKTYPHPVVDHAEARDRALKAYHESRPDDDAA